METYINCIIVCVKSKKTGYIYRHRKYSLRHLRKALDTAKRNNNGKNLVWIEGGVW